MRGWAGPGPSSLTSDQELTEGANFGPWQNGSSCSLVQLATQREVASSIVLPWLRTSPLTSTGHFSNVCGWSLGRAGEKTAAGQCISWLLCLPAGGRALAVFTREPASQWACHHLDHWALLNLSPLACNRLAFLPLFICSSVHHRSVTALQSFLCARHWAGAGNVEVKEAVSRS